MMRDKISLNVPLSFMRKPAKPGFSINARALDGSRVRRYSSGRKRGGLNFLYLYGAYERPRRDETCTAAKPKHQTAEAQGAAGSVRYPSPYLRAF